MKLLNLFLISTLFSGVQCMSREISLEGMDSIINGKGIIDQLHAFIYIEDLLTYKIPDESILKLEQFKTQLFLEVASIANEKAIATLNTLYENNDQQLLFTFIKIYLSNSNHTNVNRFKDEIKNLQELTEESNLKLELARCLLELEFKPRVQNKVITVTPETPSSPSPIKLDAAAQYLDLEKRLTRLKEGNIGLLNSYMLSNVIEEQQESIYELKEFEEQIAIESDLLVQELDATQSLEEELIKAASVSQSLTEQIKSLTEKHRRDRQIELALYEVEKEGLSKQSSSIKAAIEQNKLALLNRMDEAISQLEDVRKAKQAIIEQIERLDKEEAILVSRLENIQKNKSEYISYIENLNDQEQELNDRLKRHSTYKRKLAKENFKEALFEGKLLPKE